jgi:hypothetical protein
VSVDPNLCSAEKGGVVMLREEAGTFRCALLGLHSRVPDAAPRPGNTLAEACCADRARAPTARSRAATRACSRALLIPNFRPRLMWSPTRSRARSPRGGRGSAMPPAAARNSFCSCGAYCLIGCSTGWCGECHRGRGEGMRSLTPMAARDQRRMARDRS